MTAWESSAASWIPSHSKYLRRKASMEPNSLDRAPEILVAPEALRRCAICKTEKPRSEFCQAKSGYIRSYCRPCDKERFKTKRGAEPEERKAALREYRRAYYKAHKEQFSKHRDKYRESEAHREKERAYGRERYKENREKICAYAREWRKKNPDKQFAKVLFTKYKMTPDQYRQMETAQDNLCAICRKPEEVVRDGKPQRLGVDHDHACCPGDKSCGKCVRGLLCSACNFAIGAFKDDLGRVMLAMDYLRKWKR